MRPSPAVLASFGASAGVAPVPLPGGQGAAWRAGELVLKPAGDPRVARWTAGLYLSLSGHRDPRFRVPGPLRSAMGDWITQDPATQDPAAEASAETPAGAWVVWQWLPGEPADWAGRSPLWPRLIAASRAAAGAARGEPPAVIDFSSYWRPAGLALAVAAVDALMWSGADPAILGELAIQAGHDPADFGQLLARALVYRLVTEVIFRRGDPAGLGAAARAGQPVTGLVLKHLAVR
jgi:hypothetical protein